MWGSSNIPKAIFCLLKGDYMGDVDGRSCSLLASHLVEGAKRFSEKILSFEALI